MRFMPPRLFLCALLIFQRSHSLKPFRSRRQLSQFENAQPLDGATCVLDQAAIEVTTSRQMSMVKVRQGFLWAIPALSSLFAFLFFENVTHGFHAMVQSLSHNRWTPSTETELDLQTQVVTQVVNGPVITSISVLFATLVSITVSFLHDRQITMKSLFVKQIDELRILQVILKEMPQSVRQDSKQLTHDYTERLVHCEREEETLTDTLDVNLRKLLLFFQSRMLNERKLSPRLFELAYDSVTRIQQAQSNRWMALQTKFPTMHYATLTLLALAICISFLVATDQSLLIFESLQVRILWTILIGSFTSLAVVCYDLSSPFAGAYQIVSSVGHDELSILHDQ